MLKLIEYIKNNQDWEEKLSAEPFCLSMKRKDGFIMFSYSQIDSDFHNEIVRECRGIILHEETLTPVCVPFYKFGNYGEGYADLIDWNSAVVQEKVDGSLIKMWNYNGYWHVSTNGTIDARDAELPSDISEYHNFYALFLQAVANCNFNISLPNKDCTYMFELTSPFNRVVVPYTGIEIRHLGTRNNITLEEINVDVGIQKPKTYNLHSLEDCIKMAENLPFSDEGYVVVDKDWHRNKIKSPAYVAAHHLKNNGIITKARIITLIKLNEHKEFLVYYPEFTESFEEVENKINAFIQEMDALLTYENKNIEPRKDFALWATKTKCPAMLFHWKDGLVTNTKEWLWNQTPDKILKWIGE